MSTRKRHRRAPSPLSRAAIAAIAARGGDEHGRIMRAARATGIPAAQVGRYLRGERSRIALDELETWAAREGVPTWRLVHEIESPRAEPGAGDMAASWRAWRDVLELGFATDAELRTCLEVLRETIEAEQIGTIVAIAQALVKHGPSLEAVEAITRVLRGPERPE